MIEVYETIQDAVDSLVSKLCRKICFGFRDDIKYGESIVYGYADVETKDEDYYEIKLEVKYDEWGGGPAPDDDPWEMRVNSVSLFIDNKYEDPSIYGVSEEDFQI